MSHSKSNYLEWTWLSNSLAQINQNTYLKLISFEAMLFFFLNSWCIYWDNSPLILNDGALSAVSCRSAQPWFSFCRLTGQCSSQHTRLPFVYDWRLGWFYDILCTPHPLIGVGVLYQAPLLFPFLFWRGIKEILCKRHNLIGLKGSNVFSNKISF